MVAMSSLHYSSLRPATTPHRKYVRGLWTPRRKLLRWERSVQVARGGAEALPAVAPCFVDEHGAEVVATGVFCFAGLFAVVLRVRLFCSDVWRRLVGLVARSVAFEWASPAHTRRKEGSGGARCGKPLSHSAAPRPAPKAVLALPPDPSLHSPLASRPDAVIAWFCALFG